VLEGSKSDNLIKVR